MADETRLEAILEYIIRYKSEYDGNSPAVRDIMDATGINSTSLISYYLAVLERRGVIRLIRSERHGQMRGVAVIGGRWNYSGGGHGQH